MLAWAGMAASEKAPARSQLVVFQLSSTHRFQFAGYYAAVEQGYYRDAGLDVVLMEGPASQSHIDEVLAGRANYGVAAGGELLAHHLRGEGVVVLAAVFQHAPDVLVASKDSGILGPHDMTGKRIMLGADAESIVYRAMFVFEGVSLDRLTRLDQGAGIEALLEGTADVVAASLLEGLEGPVTVIRPASYGVDFYGDCLFTSEQEVSKYSDRCQAFRDASLRGWEYAMAHPDEIVGLLIAKYGAQATRDALSREAAAMTQLVIPELDRIGHMNPDRWGRMASACDRLGMAQSDYSLSGFMYDPEAASGGGLSTVRWLAGVTLAGGMLGASMVMVLMFFNQRLRRSVENQTVELSKLNDELRREIAERRHFGEALLESEERLAITLDSIGDGVIATDRVGRITLMNPVAERLTGWSMQDAIGISLKSAFKVINADTRRPAETPVAKVIREGKIVGPINQNVLVSRDGTECQISESGAPILDRDGHIVGVVLVFRNVTEQRRLEDQLRHSQRMEPVGRLAGGVAHDFNNLLGGILGYSEMLRDQLEGNEKLQAYAQAVLDTAGRAAELTKQLLAFSRKGKKQSVPVDVHKLIGEVISILQRTIDRRITVSQRLEALPSVTKGDPNQLESAFLNLAVNARDAMPTGGQLVFATATVNLDKDYCATFPYNVEPGEYVEVSVADTGIGMDEATMAHIFEPFFTTKTVGEGTGLGLAAVFGTVREHHGATRVYSEPGQGAAFKLYLPVDGAYSSATASSEPEPLVHGTGCILIVDDEEVIRNMAREMLHLMGYEVLWAADGEEGVRIYRENAAYIDLVMLDLVMPKVSGREALRALKKLNPRVKVLITSGFSLGMELEELSAEGAGGFIQKPFKKSELSRHVAEVLGGEL